MARFFQDKHVKNLMLSFGWIFIAFAALGLCWAIYIIAYHTVRGTVDLLFLNIFKGLLFRNFQFTLSVFLVIFLLTCGIGIVKFKLVFKKLIIFGFVVNCINEIVLFIQSFKRLETLDTFLFGFDIFFSLAVIFLVTRKAIEDYYKVKL